MDSTVILWLLAASGVVSIALFVVKGLLDQLPEVIRSWHNARRAWREQRGEESSAEPSVHATRRD